MIDETKLREKLAWLFSHSKYDHISSGVKEALPDEIVEIVKGCDVPEKPRRAAKRKPANTLTTAAEEEPKAKEENWLE